MSNTSFNVCFLWARCGLFYMLKRLPNKLLRCCHFRYEDRQIQFPCSAWTFEHWLRTPRNFKLLKGALKELVSLSLSLYIYIYIYRHTEYRWYMIDDERVPNIMNINIYIYIHIHIHIFTHVCVCMHNIYIYIYRERYIILYIRTYIVYIHIQHICIYTYIYIYISLSLYIYIYIYVHHFELLKGALNERWATIPGLETLVSKLRATNFLPREAQTSLCIYIYIYM